MLPDQSIHMRLGELWIIAFIMPPTAVTNHINKNIAVLGIENNLKVTRANITSWIGNNKDKRFDIVVADPPYDKLNIEALQKASSLLAADGLLVLSWPGGVVAPELKLMRQIKSKSYGDSSLHYYKRII